MKASLKIALPATSLMSLPLAAHAQSWDPLVQGFYVGAGVGTNYLQNADSDRTSISFNWGWAGVMSVGYGFGNGLRLEVEGSYRHNDVDSIRFSGTNMPVPSNGAASTSGDATSYGAMVNVLYDFNLGPVVPYIGVGIGYVWHDYGNVGVRETFTARSSTGGSSFVANATRSVTVGGTNGALSPIRPSSVSPFRLKPFPGWP